MEDELKIKHVKAKSILTKNNTPLGGYSVNPYVGCTHGCKYCYASFMKRLTGHFEDWGTFLDVKDWDKIGNPKWFKGRPVLVGSVTDGYNPQDAEYKRTRRFLEEMVDSGAKLTIITKSDLVVRDIDLLTQMDDVTVAWSVNTLDEKFRRDMDNAVSIERRLSAMKEVYNAGIRTVCFISPVFPGITRIEDIFERVRYQCDMLWLENLNLRGDYKSRIMNYINESYPELLPLYQSIYYQHDRAFFIELERLVKEYAEENGCRFVDNKIDVDRAVNGYPVFIDYFYHEEVRGTGNTGVRNI